MDVLNVSLILFVHRVRQDFIWIQINARNVTFLVELAMMELQNAQNVQLDMFSMTLIIA